MTMSKRTAWDRVQNAIARELSSRTHPPIDLTEGNPTRVGFAPPLRLHETLRRPGVELYEPDPRGMLEAREAVSDYYREKGHEVSASDLFLTSSTSEAYSWLFKLLCDPGDRVLVPAPGYPLFEYLAKLEGVDVEPYPLRWDGSHWSIDLAAVRDAKAEAIVVVSPGNPTGSFLKKKERDALGEMGRPIICDEVFGDYAFEADPTRVETAASWGGALCFTLSGFSKVIALPQMKLAWIAVSGPHAKKTEAIARLEIVADTYLSPSSPVQMATQALLGSRLAIQGEILARVRANRAALDAEIGKDHPATVLRAEGGWYAIVRMPRVKSDEEWVLSLLRERDVLVQPGYFFDFDSAGFLVISLLPEPKIFANAIARVAAHVKSLA